MVPKLLLCTFAALTLLSGTVNAARILVLGPNQSRSHQIWISALMLGLAKRGHQITALIPETPMEPNPNIKPMIVEGSFDKLLEKISFEQLVNLPPLESSSEIGKWSLEICRHQLATKAAKDLLNMPPDSFDLILAEVAFSECIFMYLHHFGGGTRIPVVGFSCFGIGPWTDIVTGARTMASVFPYPILPYQARMNIWERSHNTFITVGNWAGILKYCLPKNQEIAEIAYGKPLPSFFEIATNISLILVNNHYALNGPQAQLPGIVEVGAMHCSPPKPLPKDIQSFLDEAEQGAIFFSLGSNVQSELLPKEKLRIIVDTFAALGPKIRVLWKFNPKVPIEELPSNVLLKKWLPQEDVLGHPKILAFVSHAGLLSTHEAIYHGKPVVAVPFFNDQHVNALRMVEMNVAEHVDFVSITKESFTKKILNVINNSSYHTNMGRLSSLIRDQPQTPLERAIFWVEFTLRHGKGRVEALRFAGLDLAWYQYFLLDVFAIIFFFIFFITMVGLLVIYALFICFNKAFNSIVSKVKSEKIF